MRQLGSAAAATAFVMAMALLSSARAQTPPAPNAPAATDSSAASAASASSTPLSGATAWPALVGNTIEGKVAGQDFADFFDKGGAVRHVDQNGLSSGTWSLQDDKVCLDFPDDDERNCLRLEVHGTAGTAQDDDGETIRFTILPGNSKGL